jgi:hypothetical protein
VLHVTTDMLSIDVSQGEGGGQILRRLGSNCPLLWVLRRLRRRDCRVPQGAPTRLSILVGTRAKPPSMIGILSSATPLCRPSCPRRPRWQGGWKPPTRLPFRLGRRHGRLSILPPYGIAFGLRLLRTKSKGLRCPQGPRREDFLDLWSQIDGAFVATIGDLVIEWGEVPDLARPINVARPHDHYLTWPHPS